MGAIGVGVPLVIIMGGIVYVRRFENRLENLEGDIDVLGSNSKVSGNQAKANRLRIKRLDRSVWRLTVVNVIIGTVVVVAILIVALVLLLR